MAERAYTSAEARMIAMLTAGATASMIQAANPGVALPHERIIAATEGLLEELGVPDATADELRRADEQLRR